MTQQNEFSDILHSPEYDRLPKGRFMYLEVDTYRTEDGQALFTFGFEEVGDRIEVDIVSQPSYGSRASDAHSTHRLESDRGGKMICFGDPDFIDHSNARKWAAEWAEASWKYIKTGKTF